MPLPDKLDPEVVMCYTVGDSSEDVIVSIGDGRVNQLHRLSKEGAEALVGQLFLLGYGGESSWEI